MSTPFRKLKILEPYPLNLPDPTWKKLLLEDDPPTAHENTHVDGGTDEIDSALDPVAYPMLAGTLAARPAVGVAGRFYWTTDEHILYRDTGAAWVKVAVADYPDLDSIPASFTPAAHKVTHEDTGADEISIEGLVGSPAQKAAASGLASLDASSRVVQSAKTLKDADGDTKIDVEEGPDEDKVRMDVKGVEAFLLDDAGVLNLVKQSSARAYLGTPQNVNDATWTRVDLDTEVWDIQSEFDTTTHKLTVKKAGLYLMIGGNGYLNTDVVADKPVSVAIRKNGASVGSLAFHTAVATWFNLQVMTIDNLAVDDEIELYAWHNFGAVTPLRAHTAITFLIVHKIA